MGPFSSPFRPLDGPGPEKGAIVLPVLRTRLTLGGDCARIFVAGETLGLGFFQIFAGFGE